MTTVTTTITTTKRHAVHEMAFNALFDKITDDITTGDGALLALTRDCINDPDGTLTTRRPTPDHRRDPDAPAGWAILTNPDLLSTAKTAANLIDLSLAAAVTPDGTDEIRRTTATIARRLGVTRGRALAYCEVGTMLTRLPATCSAVACGAFSLDLLRIIADVTCCVATTYLDAVDTGIAALLTPTRPDQVIPGPVILRRSVTAIVGTCQPTALPVDPEDQDVPPPALQTDFSIDTRNDDYTVFHITVPADEGLGVTRIVDAVADAHHCSRATAFTELCHGAVGDVTVTLNCYRNIDTGHTHLENRWLTGIATDRWIRRVTHLTVPSHSAHDARFATDNQRALLAGIDGTCRAPGCENPAATADADHVHRYDSEHPDNQDTPRTDTGKMQSLCRGCHNDKTRGLLDFTQHPDGTTSVTSIDDGHTVTTVPTGPMATAITTFDQSLARKVAARAEHNEAREQWRATTRTALGQPPF
jgi:hypothetical protein